MPLAPKGTPRKAAKGGSKAPTISPRQVPGGTSPTPRTAAATVMQRQARKGAGKKKKKRDPDAEIATFLHVMGLELARVEAEGRDRHRSDLRLDEVHVAVLQPELRMLEAQLDIKDAQLRVAQLPTRAPGRVTNLENEVSDAVRLLQEEEVRTRLRIELSEEVESRKQELASQARALEEGRAEVEAKRQEAAEREAALGAREAKLDAQVPRGGAVGVVGAVGVSIHSLGGTVVERSIGSMVCPSHGESYF